MSDEKKTDRDNWYFYIFIIFIVFAISYFVYAQYRQNFDCSTNPEAAKCICDEKTEDQIELKLVGPIDNQTRKCIDEGYAEDPQIKCKTIGTTLSLYFDNVTESHMEFNYRIIKGRCLKAHKG